MIIGTRLGPYEVLGVIGAGGMGEVYRARDTNLHRDVAIKVLPEAMAANPTRLLRFEREARALAALNHPNIAAIYGVQGDGPSSPLGEARPLSPGEARPLRALVMEFVEGEDLSARLKRGPLSIEDALQIARQVAEALAAAHDAGIVHRDLKPANIKVRADGTVKVLDFGLAKGGSAEPGSSTSSAGSSSGSGSQDLLPTLTLDGEVTQDGVVLGTAAYMSPEQAKGKLVDKRADIWSFGVVLFEMLAGRRPFVAEKGADPADMMAHVLARDPEWSALPPNTPQPVRRLLARCLTKDRRRRLHDIADARLEIDEAIAPRQPGEFGGDAAVAGVTRGVHWAWFTAALLCVAVGIGIGMVMWKVRTSTPLVTYAALDVSPAAELNAGGVHPSMVLAAGGARTALAWSPNGRAIAFIGVMDGVRQVFLRDLGSRTARPLAGTNGASTLAFSPDAEEVAFTADGVLQKVRIAGGPPSKLYISGDMNGITWGPTRMVGSTGSLWLIDAVTSEKATLILTPPELVRTASPFLLPGDHAILYTEYRKQWTSGGERVMVLSLTPGSLPKVLINDAADARYLPTGHIAFLRQGTLFVVPFDLATFELRGDPVAVVKDVAQAAVAWDSADLTLAGQYAISPQGMLAYVSSPLAVFPDRELVTVDRSGAVAPIGAPNKGYRSHVELSPDGTRLAVSIQTTTDIRLFSYDIARRSLSRVAESLKGEIILASWSRDDQIAVQVVDGGMISAALVRPDIASPAEPVADTIGFWASSLSMEGRLVGMRGGDLWIHSPRVKGLPASVLMKTPTGEYQPVWSPDGRWLAYTSATTGRGEVYLRPYPGPGESIMVSSNGGNGPSWNPNGQELFYIEPGANQDRMMAGRVSASGPAGAPAALFAFPHGGLFLGTIVLTPYTVAKDGQHFYTVRQLPQTPAPVTQINVILNWFEDLKTKVPAVR